MLCFVKDHIDGFVDPGNDEVRGMLGSALIVSVIDEDRRASGACSGIDVSPAITDHKAFRKIDVVPLCRLEE